jgi:hypothetical protein
MDPQSFSLALERVFHHDLIQCAAVCKLWKESALAPGPWLALCHQHFKRHYVPDSIKTRLSERSSEAKSHPMTILRECYKDLQRKELSEPELTGFTWNFRFKAAAGNAWISQDPWWNGEAPAEVWFRPGGAVEREPPMEGISIQWQWGRKPTSVKCIVNNRPVPTYVVGRHPEHGGFFMHSCWALYTAFPMQPKDEDQHMTDEALRLTAEEQMDEVMEYNSGLQSLLRVGNYNVEIPPQIAQLLEGAPDDQRRRIIQALFQAAVDDDDDDDDDNDGGHGGYLPVD